MRVAAVALALCLAAAGCGGSGDEGTAQVGDGFGNPVYTADTPDPHVIRAGDQWYLYATNGELGNVQTLRSADLVRWESVGDALPKLPSWAVPGKTWAPEVIGLAPDRYVMYFTAASYEHGVQCVGRAVADKPDGPFVDESTEPLICQKELGGAIDADPFRDKDGSLTLLWKNDGNAIGEDTWLWAQRLSPDGLTLTGKPTQLLKQDAGWEGTLIEGPSLWRHDDQLYLFYSANAYDSDRYAVGYARCDSPLGPCVKAEENPILTSSGDAAGPGHNCLVEKDGKTWMVYHAWPADSVGSPVPGRQVWLSEVTWTDGRPVVAKPSSRVASRP